MNEQDVMEKAADLLQRTNKLVGEYFDWLLRQDATIPPILIKVCLAQAALLYLRTNPLADESEAVAHLRAVLDKFEASTPPAPTAN